MLRKRIKKNTLKWKKIYAEQLLDMMDEEENALQKIYLTDGTKTGSFAVPWSMHVIFQVPRQRKSMYISIWDLQA